MADQSSIPKVTILTIVLSFLGGGLAGAVFTWYVHRPQPTYLTYSMGTTPLAAPEATSLIPNLRVQIGAEPIKALYAHTVEFGVPRGPHIDNVDVAITFPNRVRIYGKSVEAPSRVHSITCSELEDGLRCTMSPIAPGLPRNYRIVIATDEKQPPSILTATKDVEL